MSQVFSSSDGSLCVHLLYEVQEQIKEAVFKSHPLETGGILIGRYDGNFRLSTVYQAIFAPPDSRHGQAYFERGTDGVTGSLAMARQKNPHLHYIGEWHSHPGANPSPSRTDTWQMQKFVSLRQYGAQTPLLLIVGGTPPDSLQWHFSLYCPSLRPIHLLPI